MAGLLTALLYGAGGYGQGRQQAVQNKQNQEQIDAENAYRTSQTQLEQQKMKLAQDQYQRSTGVDPATGKPFVLPPALQQIRPNNKGKGGLVTDADQLQHLYAYGSWLTQTGQLDQAASVMDRAKNMETDIRANQRLQQQGMIDQFNQGEQDARADKRLQAEDVLADKRSSDEDRRQANLFLQEDNLESRREDARARLQGSGGKGANKAATDEATWYTKWSKLTTAQNSQVPGVKNPPVIPPAQAAAASKKFSAIDRAGDPRAVAQALANKEPNAAIKALILERGNVAAEKKAGASSGDTGVSDDGENPTKGEKIPPHDIWQMVYESGATPEEATTLTSIAMAESGGDPTSVNRTDNHGKQTSWGLFQVSDGTHHEPHGWQNPEENIQMALAKLRSQGLQAWGTYNSGAYRKFMPAAEQGE